MYDEIVDTATTDDSMICFLIGLGIGSMLTVLVFSTLLF